MKKLLYVTILNSAFAWADCKFVVNNYSDTRIKVEAGFFDGNNKKLEIPINGEKIIVIKSDHECTTRSITGFGVVYINLIGGKSQGGWVYSPDADMIRAVGSNSDSRGALGISPNGTKLILFHRRDPRQDKFEVSVEKASRNTSLQNSSMD